MKLSPWGFALLSLVSLLVGCWVYRDSGDPRYIVTGGRVLNVLSLGDAERYVGKLAWPTTTQKISSKFGYRKSSFHEGIDIPNIEGEPVYAAFDGKVVYLGSDLSGYGKTIALKHGPVVTVYSHLSEYSVSLRDYVVKGDEIGLIGETGVASGPHLHFETRVKNTAGIYFAVDPMLFFRR